MSAKRAVLSSMTVKAPAAALPASGQPAPAVMADPPLSALKQDKAMTVHMKRSTWLELDGLAKSRDTTMHALLIEGMKLVFEKYGADPGHVLVGKRPPRKAN